MTISPGDNGTKFFEGRLNLNNFLVFIFGVIFISVILGFAISFPNPTTFQFKVFNVVLALSAAGIGAQLPGALGIEWGSQIAGVPLVKAGGALALFVLVLVSNQQLETVTVRLVKPDEPAEPIISNYLAATDVGDLNKAWSLIDAEAKGLVFPSLEELAQTYKNAREPLGAVSSRLLVGTTGFESPVGMPVGLYRGYNYKTKFLADGGLCRPEAVVVKATQALHWEIFSHQIAPNPVAC